jgi:hypothetical protein
MQDSSTATNPSSPARTLPVTMGPGSPWAQSVLDLLAPYFGDTDAWIGMVYQGVELRLHDLGTGATRHIGDSALVDTIWNLIPHPRGFGVNGRRVLPLILRRTTIQIAKRGGTSIYLASRLRWATTLTWERSFGGIAT